MASSLVATQTTLRRRPAAAPAAFSLPSAVIHRLPVRLSFSPLPRPSKLRISASVSPTIEKSSKEFIKILNPNQDILSGSTRTVTTLFAIALTASRFFAQGIINLAVQLKEPLLPATGVAFFAAAKSTSNIVYTPLTVVAAGMAKWLDLYCGVMLVRVLLSWFPNVPWDRQPLSAIRDLCDPYLNLFRNIIPPLFDTLDISPILAFAVMGLLGGLLKSTRYAVV